uniref:Uncharacterized protein n=1 Tax=Sinocyclocheilus rhinocerous TaxID=307959 RepID=A0A673HTJ1_9TELE
MALFSSVFRQLFEHFAHFLRRRETPQRAQCAAQEWAGESKAFTANDRKCRKRCRKVPAYKEKKIVYSLEKLMEGGSEHREAGEKKKKKRKLKEQKATEPTPLLVEVKPQQTVVSPPVRSSFLKPIEGELPMLQSVSEHLTLPAARFKPLPPVTKPPMRPQKPAPAPEEVSLPCSPLQVDPPKPLAVPPRPTPAHDELFSLRHSQVHPPKRLVVPPSPTPSPDEVVDLLVKPQPSTSSLFEPPPQLLLIDIEDEENEYVEYTGKTIRACDLLKSERHRPLEAEMKPRQMVAWLESDSEVLEEVWASEVVEVQGCEEEKNNPGEMGDSKAIEGHLEIAYQKKKEMDELMMKLFCVTSPEEKVKKKEKKIRKEKERREKELLLERYRKDPKLKHLLINKHNRHYCSSE